MKTVSIFLLLFLVSCTQSGSHTQPQNSIPDQQPLPKAGIVNKHIACMADTSFSYAVYLPDAYAVTEKTFPIIFFFDAHHRGALPLEKYAALAEEYGFILAGSNNSTNGQGPEAMQKAVSMMVQEVLKNFRVDSNRMATSGFSGGARVAADVALFQNKGVSAVIGCAAGFPQMHSPYHTHFSYLGMVGDKDFNYLEMKNLDKALEPTPIPHYLLVYDGKHDWPPADVMRDGFGFLLFAAMRRNTVLKDERLIDEFLKRNDSIRNKAITEKDLDKLADTDKKVWAFLQGLTPLDKYTEELNNLQKNPVYIKMQEAQNKSLTMERSRQQQYASALPTRDLQWWLAEINRLQKQDDPVNVRLLNYLSLVSYMYASGTLRNNQLKEAEKYLAIYEKVDPENPEVYYLKATLLVRTGKAKEALQQLKKAADYGFTELERINKNGDFSLLSERADFQDVLSRIKSNYAN